MAIKGYPGKHPVDWMGQEVNEKRKAKISATLKKKFKENPAAFKNIIGITKRIKEQFGYYKSPKTIKKLSNSISNIWKEGKVTEKQRQTLFKQGKDSRRENTQFKEGHETSEKTIAALKESRSKQIFPLIDSSIEKKMQNLLKQLNVEFITHKHMSIEHAYQCDFFIPSMNMVLETDGMYWHNYPIGNPIDITRSQELREKGFKVLRLWESEIKKIEPNELQQLLLKCGGKD